MISFEEQGMIPSDEEGMISFDEQYYDRHFKLVQKGFFMEKATRPITLDTEPRDGFEFIYKSRLEDAKVDFSTNKNKKKLPRSITPTRNMKLSGRKEAKEFFHLAKKLKSKKQMLIKKFPKVIETPDLDEKEWCAFCFGSKFCSEIYGKVVKKHLKKGHQPLLSIVLHLSQEQIKSLISYQYKWFQIVGMDNSMGRWIYALFCNLEKPVDDDYQPKLEAFHDYCEKILNSLEGSNKDRVYLILSILKHYFGVKYYTSGPSLGAFANIPNLDSDNS